MICCLHQKNTICVYNINLQNCVVNFGNPKNVEFFVDTSKVLAELREKRKDLIVQKHTGNYNISTKIECKKSVKKVVGKT